jgi:hypothetical protein
LNVGITTESTTELSLRLVVLLALVGQVFVVAASFGFLNGWVMAATLACCMAFVASGVWRVAQASSGAQLATRNLWLLALLPLILLALYPPLAFDETLYHLPYIESIARSGAISFRGDIRFGVFPLLHELLCVPLFVAFGATATHLMATLELALLGALVIAWPARRDAGLLAAAIVLGNPAMLLPSSVTYVDVALTLFVAAGFFALQRERPLLAGFLLGTSTAVKYLGWFFVVAALLYVGRRWPKYIAGVAVGALPMLLRIFILTGDPLHPYLRHSWAGVGVSEGDAATRVLRFVRLLYDMTFAREYVNQQPPYTPFFVLALIIGIFVARRSRLGAICLAYLIAFVTVMPADSRYLLPLVPLVAVAAAQFLTKYEPRTLRMIAIVAAIPLVLYPMYWIARRGLPPWRYDVHERIPSLRALEHKGPGGVYVCGAEELKWFGKDELIGDHFGPYAYPTMARDGLPDVPWVLISKRSCPERWRTPFTRNATRVYEDDAAELWKRTVAR